MELLDILASDKEVSCVEKKLGLKKGSEKKEKVHSPTGNRTRVFRVTGGDTYHYTIEDLLERVKKYVRIYTLTSFCRYWLR